MKGKEGARKVALGKLSDRVAVFYLISSPIFLSHCLIKEYECGKTTFQRHNYFT